MKIFVILALATSVLAGAAFAADAKPEVGQSPVRGNKAAPVTIFEFSDFQCPYCSQVETTLDSLMKKYDGRVKLVYKLLPLDMHPQAMIAAEAGVAAQNQGKFWQMHDLMFSNQHSLTHDDLIADAKKLKLNTKEFEKDLKASKTAKRIQGDISLAHSLGFQGTPSFMVNGQQIVGAADQKEFEGAIDKSLK